MCRLTYQGRSSSKKHRVKFGSKLADGKWHRLGISVKGNSITAISDCKKQQTRAIDRGGQDDALSNTGIVLLAQEIDDNTFFDVSILFLREIASTSVLYPLPLGDRLSI